MKLSVMLLSVAAAQCNGLIQPLIRVYERQNLWTSLKLGTGGILLGRRWTGMGGAGSTPIRKDRRSEHFLCMARRKRSNPEDSSEEDEPSSKPIGSTLELMEALVKSEVDMTGPLKLSSLEEDEIIDEQLAVSRAAKPIMQYVKRYRVPYKAKRERQEAQKRAEQLGEDPMFYDAEKEVSDSVFLRPPEKDLGPDYDKHGPVREGLLPKDEGSWSRRAELAKERWANPEYKAAQLAKRRPRKDAKKEVETVYSLSEIDETLKAGNMTAAEAVRVFTDAEEAERKRRAKIKFRFENPQAWMEQKLAEGALLRATMNSETFLIDQQRKRSEKAARAYATRRRNAAARAAEAAKVGISVADMKKNEIERKKQERDDGERLEASWDRRRQGPPQRTNGEMFIPGSELGNLENSKAQPIVTNQKWESLTEGSNYQIDEEMEYGEEGRHESALGEGGGLENGRKRRGRQPKHKELDLEMIQPVRNMSNLEGFNSGGWPVSKRKYDWGERENVEGSTVEDVEIVESGAEAETQPELLKELPEGGVNDLERAAPMPALLSFPDLFWGGGELPTDSEFDPSLTSMVEDMEGAKEIAYSDQEGVDKGLIHPSTRLDEVPKNGNLVDSLVDDDMTLDSITHNDYDDSTVVDSSIVNEVIPVDSTPENSMSENPQIGRNKPMKRSRVKPKIKNVLGEKSSGKLVEGGNTVVVRRGRGRPRKIVEDDGADGVQKELVGRSRTQNIVPKRPRGRPKKVRMEASDVDVPKRPRGQPRKVSEGPTTL
ncbi:unnamed protein product [Choristocarpus tenellus]